MLFFNGLVVFPTSNGKPAPTSGGSIDFIYRAMQHKGLSALLEGFKSAAGDTMNIHNPPKTPPSPGGNGAGRRRPRRTPKGRQVDPQALEEVRYLLLYRSRR